MNRVLRTRSLVYLMAAVELVALMSAVKWSRAAGGQQSQGQPVPNPPGQPEGLRALGELTVTAYLPVISRVTDACGPIPGASYGSFPVIPPPTDRPAEEHADLNLALRGYELTSAYLGLVTYGGATDPGAPQLAGLFADERLPTFSAASQVHHWDWGRNRRGPAITDPPVTLLGMATSPGETIHVPQSGYTIGGGYEVLVLYAEPHRITLKYTGEDNVVWGYTLHLENICVDPDLLALYQQWNDDGRAELPALQSGQPFAVAHKSEIGVAIRDTGTFLDPRSEKDWWQ